MPKRPPIGRFPVGFPVIFFLANLSPAALHGEAQSLGEATECRKVRAKGQRTRGLERIIEMQYYVRVGAFTVTLAALVLIPAQAGAGNRYVSRHDGNDGSSCSAASSPCKTIARALTVAQSGDTINVVGEKHRVSLRFDTPTTLTLVGAWDPTFATRDPVNTPTVLKAKTRRYATGAKDKRVCVMVAEAGEAIDLTFDGFVFTGGRARATGAFMGDPLFPLMQDGGAGVYAHAAGGTIALTVRQSAITRNKSAITAGGGLFVGASVGGTADVTIDRSTITDNVVNYGGGIEAVATQFVDDPPTSVHVTVVNSIIAGNHSEGAAAIFVLGYGGQALLDLHSSTLTANSDETDLGEYPEGAVVLNRAVGNVTNTIIWGNTLEWAAPGADLLVGDTAVANLDHSDVGNAATDFGGAINDVGGSVSVDPQLLGIHLRAGSPLIDAGTCTGAPPLDFDGDPRPSGATCDIGADELVP